MTRLAPTLQAYFTTRLTGELGASPHTVAGYRDTWRLLLRFAALTRGWKPQQLDLDQLDAALVSDFLTHLETDRGNSIRTRNARLAAIHFFYRYAALRHPEHAATIAGVLDIPAKRHHRTDLTYLTADEVTALLTAPDPSAVAGRRDHAMLQLAVTTGLRVSELTALAPPDVHLGTGAARRLHREGTQTSHHPARPTDRSHHPQLPERVAHQLRRPVPDQGGNPNEHRRRR